MQKHSVAMVCSWVTRYRGKVKKTHKDGAK